jgi:hypothetical protein
MLLIAGLVLGLVWLAVVAVVVGVCMSAARGDRTRVVAAPAPARTGRFARVRMIA